MNGKRIWYPFTLEDRNARVYRVSFLLAEEATWDHRFHGLDGRELAAEDLRLTPADLRYIQASCDSAVGSARQSAIRRPLTARRRVASTHVGARYV
jgi:hypothetical protein